MMGGAFVLFYWFCLGEGDDAGKNKNTRTPRDRSKKKAQRREEEDEEAGGRRRLRKFGVIEKRGKKKE